MRDIWLARAQPIPVDDIHVGFHSGAQNPSVMQPHGRRGGGGQAPDQFLGCEFVKRPAPMRQHPGLEARVQNERDMRTAIAQSHDAVAVVQQCFSHGQIAIGVT